MAADPGSTRDQTLADFTAALAARRPVPGGGGAAAVTAALACASAAMACRYTTGERYAAVSAEAEALALRLDAAGERALTLADADAIAFTGVTAAKKTKDPAAIAAAEQAAAAVPAELIALAVDTAAAAADFRGRCNPWLVSDIDTGLHLLAGAARAAWCTLAINRPPATVLDAARDRLKALARYLERTETP